MNLSPYATDSQREVEDRAILLIARPELKRAKEMVATLFRNACAWPERDQADRFDNMVDEYIFHHALRAANGDPDSPTAIRLMAPAHHWFGRDVPGSRWGGDSADFIYRTIPVAHGGRYVIRGRPTCTVAPIVFYSLMADTTAAPVTLAHTETADLQFESDGSFIITVDDRPAEGRPNHLQTKPGADFVMVRDAFGDWLGQSPFALTVERKNPTGIRRSIEDMAALAARTGIQSIYYTYYSMQSGKGQEPNSVRTPQASGMFGGVPTQWGTKGHIDLAEDDALIVRCNEAGARFRNAMLTDAFHVTIEYWKRTSSLNMDQVVPDEDGNFTYVISHQDPGVHNWLDTGGLRRTNFGHRWQAFDKTVKTPQPWLTTHRVKLDDLEKFLPRGARRIGDQMRAWQISAREAGIARRFSESFN